MPAAPGRLAGRSALVTGSSAGIGEAIARRFAAEGAAVAVHGLVLAEAEQVASSLREGGAQAVALAGDLGAPLVPEAVASAALEALGRVDILVNNAAVKTRSDLESTDAALFDAVIAVNLRAPLLLVRALLASFRSAGGGVVLNIGSLNAHCGEARLLAYSVAKGGLTTMTRNLADAYATEGIRVNQINPGWVLTASEDVLKREDGLAAGWEEQLGPAVAPSGSLLAPEDIAHFALAFVEDGAHRVSGAVVDLEQYPIIGRNPPKQTGAEATTR